MISIYLPCQEKEHATQRIKAGVDSARAHSVFFDLPFFAFILALILIYIYYH